MTRQTVNETPSFAEVIRLAVEQRLASVNTSMPAIVKSYNSLTNTVDIQPAIKRKMVGEDGELEVSDLPVIFDVPVMMYRADEAVINMPIAKGCKGVAFFSQRSIERYKLEGGVVEAQDPRKFDLSDAMFYPGGTDITDAIPHDPNDMTIKYRSAKITLKKNGSIILQGKRANIELNSQGKITIGNGAIELLSLLDKFADECQKLTVGTALGPSSTPINAPLIKLIQEQLKIITG